jgi:hypothetical protein
VSRLLRSERGEGAANLILPVVVIVVLFIGGFFLFAYRSVDVGQVALQYGGGPFDTMNNKFVAVHKPGRHVMGIDENVFPYPDTVRNYQFAPLDDGRLTGDAPPVPCVTKGAQAGEVGPRIDLNGQFVFFLNTGDILGEFHRLFGVRYKAYEHFDDSTTGEGWPTMLNETARPIMESTIVAACRNFTVDDLSRQESIDALEVAVGTQVTARLHDRMKGDFFCGAHNDGCKAPIAFQLKPVLPPAGLADAATRVAVATKNLEAAKKEAESIDALRQKGLTGMAAVAHECLQVPQCRDSMTFVGGDAAVSVPAK